ncbi:MAG: NADP-dependent oxidoreductase [Actinobacteria bacterium]|nr:NADP-dependent oxidoreductase [Actinomycetota bacterium]MBO0835294.1 NADP-dependent oxidoreductase [Actinomycetota bacterium]
MRAVGVTKFGGPEVLEIVELPMPEPGDGEVRIKVAAATVNPSDAAMRAGVFGPPPQGDGPPYVAGWELAGVVDAVGAGADWSPGERVFAIVQPYLTGRGAQAEYVVVPADSVARIPKGMKLASAATLPMNGLTARLALDKLALEPGQTIAVTGAAGAVGGYVMELAAHEGLKVIGDASPDDTELVKSLGADIVVPRGPDVAAAIRREVPAGVDAAVDAALIGPPLLAAVRDGGQLIAVRPFDGESWRSITITLCMVGDYLHEAAKLAELAKLAKAGKLTLRVAREIPAEKAAEAHRQLEAGGTRGRLVLTF